VTDHLNENYGLFFEGDSWINGGEYLLHQHVHFCTFMWISWRDNDNESHETILARDVKYTSFPVLNIPFPFKKRR